MHTSLNHYIHRYLPSKERLQRICSKRGIPMPSYDEVPALKERLQYYTVQGLSRMRITEKLLSQGFSRENIAPILSTSQRDFISVQRKIEQKIESWYRKFRSRSALLYTLEHEYPEFRNEIYEMMHAYDERKSLHALLEYSHTQPWHTEKTKIIQSLLRKGFTLRDIHAELSENTHI